MKYRNVIQCDVAIYNPVEDMTIDYGPIIIIGFFILLALIIVSGIILYKVYKDMDKKEERTEFVNGVNMNNEVSTNISMVNTLENKNMAEQEREKYNDGPVVSFGGTDNNSYSGTTIDSSDNQV